MAHAHSTFQKTEAKPEFTDYTVAGTVEGRLKAEAIRADYEIAESYIRTGRSLRRMCRKTADNAFDNQGNAIEVAVRTTAQSSIRCGYPTKRERNEDIPSHRGVPYSRFLKQFKIIEKLVGTGFGDFVWVAKVYVLHATRGWKLYA